MPGTTYTDNAIATAKMRVTGIELLFIARSQVYLFNDIEQSWSLKRGGKGTPWQMNRTSFSSSTESPVMG